MYWIFSRRSYIPITSGNKRVNNPGNYFLLCNDCLLYSFRSRSKKLVFKTNKLLLFDSIIGACNDEMTNKRSEVISDYYYTSLFGSPRSLKEKFPNAKQHIFIDGRRKGKHVFCRRIFIAENGSHSIPHPKTAMNFH